MMWLKTILFILFVLALSAAALTFYGARRWRTSTDEVRRAMESGRLDTAPADYDPAALDVLPPPLRRYFETVLPKDAKRIASASIFHEGRFNMDESGEKWVPFRSDQFVVTRRPGFDWSARIRMAPGIGVLVRDAYVAGEGLLLAKVLGLLTVADMRGTPEMAEGELMRFLAEALWYPTALLPGEALRWEAIDDRSARATLHDGDASVTLDFRFDSEGLIDAVSASKRFRTVEGRLAATPWRGRFWNYERRGGFLIPLEGEVEWLLPEGPKPYWRGRITRIDYEFRP